MSERPDRVAELVESALEREPVEWPAFLDETCAGDPDLRAEVESLLSFHERAGDFIEVPDFGLAATVLAAAAGLTAGQRFGGYKILSPLGEGGMGEVYLAEEVELGRRVAVKIVKRGFGTADVLRRFRREERILAGLNHPNVARLFGGGKTDMGLPYFVMEYVEGQPVDEYADAHRLTTPERLKLFRTVCGAVAHAHRHLVVHRDLKPSNILVTGEGVPKLLDFGIAKLLDTSAAGLDRRTVTLLGAMTPEYASPEQVRGLEITTASDIYSLGVVLYKLLTGRHPYRFKTLLPTEIEKVVCETEPERPSKAFRDAPTGESSSSPPGTPRPCVAPPQLRGDLDNIVLMALRKEPERRYPSVEQFSEDIRRYLENLPVSATNDTFRYRACKFINRHRTGVAATLLIALALVGGIVTTTWQARAARRERDKAQRVSLFLQDVLGAAAPEVKGPDVKVVDLLAGASGRAKTELADRPEVLADVLMTTGKTYISLGQLGPAEADLRAALDASLRANGELHPTTATGMGWLGLALALENKFAEGEQIARRAVELQRGLHPGGHEDLAVALYGLGTNLIQKGEAEAAEPLLREAVALIKKHLGENHGYHMAALTMLGMAREREGDLDGAESLYREAIAVGRGVDYRFRIFTAQSSNYLGVLLIKRGAYPEAESLLRESESIYREVLGDGNSNIGIVKMNLGWLYFLTGDYARAEDEDKKALDLLRKHFSRENPLTVTATAALGSALTRAGKPAEGEPYLREALEIRKIVLPQGDVQIPVTESALGECLTARRRFAEAELLLVESHAALHSRLGPGDPRTAEALRRVVRLYEAWGKPEQAAVADGKRRGQEAGAGGR